MIVGQRWYELTGQKFGRLTVLGAGKSRKAKRGTKKYWACRCDCGTEKELVTYALVGKRATRSCGCIRIEQMKALRGIDHHNWKGGRVGHDGYVALLAPDHPNAWTTGYVLEHIAVMSRAIGRGLCKGETVHHRNGIKNGNRIENLELWSSSHPCGQRIPDKIDWCVEFLQIYAPEMLSQDAQAKDKQVEDRYGIRVKLVRHV